MKNFTYKLASLTVMTLSLIGSNIHCMERSNVGRVGNVTTQTVSPDGKTIVVCYADGTVRVIYIPTGTMLFQFHSHIQGVITSAEVSSDGTIIFVTTGGGRVYAFETRTGTRLQ